MRTTFLSLFRHCRMTLSYFGFDLFYAPSLNCSQTQIDKQLADSPDSSRKERYRIWFSPQKTQRHPCLPVLYRNGYVCVPLSLLALFFLTNCLSACRLHLHLSPHSSSLMQHKPYNGGKQLEWGDVISESFPLLPPLSLILPASQAQPPLSGFSEIHTFFFYSSQRLRQQQWRLQCYLHTVARQQQQVRMP